MPAGKDPLRLGFRERAVTKPDGRSVLEQIPLTPEDLLYPQEGDVVADGFPHNWFLIPLYDAIRRHLMKVPATLVTFSTVLVLGDGKNSSPDVAVIKGDVDISGIRRAVKLHALGGRLVFALEAVSTSEKEIKDKDLKKNVVRYAAEGVKEYLTVFPVVERKVK
ncbi:MAG: Uma2 family endonuclease, partial [bacterium]|nr:Uma2 family endonuclease [bacterium]